MLSSPRIVLAFSTACLLVLVTGCETMSSVGGAFSDDDSGGEVRRNEASVAECEFIQEVEVNRNPRIGENTTEGMLSNKAAAVGGNVVLITAMESREGRGKAYKCPEDDEEKEDDTNK